MIAIITKFFHGFFKIQLLQFNKWKGLLLNMIKKPEGLGTYIWENNEIYDG